MSRRYLLGIFVGSVEVDASNERQIVDIIASTPINPSNEDDWNSQHYLEAALTRLSSHGVLSTEQVDQAIDQMFDAVLDGAVA